MSKPKHRLSKNRRPGKLQCKSTPHRLSLQQIQRRQWAGQMGGIGVAAMVIAIPLLVGVDAVAGFPIDLASPPSAPAGQRPPGPSWLPGVGAGLRTSPNPLFRVPLDAGVASQPEVLRAALSLTLPSSGLSPQTPIGHWVGTRWVPTDPFVHPTTPCPSPVLDPIGFRLWFARWFPNVTLPAPPVVSAPPAAPTTPPSVPVVAPVAAPVDAGSVPLPAASPVAETPPPAEQPAPVVEVSPATVDPPPLDVPPVVVDLPVLPPVEVDVPPIDLPPISVPPVDVSPVTDPVTDVLPAPVGDVVDGVTSVLSAPADLPSQDAKTGAAEKSVPSAATADSVVAPVDGISESTRAGAEQHPTLLDTRTDHSTSENVLSDVKNRGRLAGKDEGERTEARSGAAPAKSPSLPRGSGVRLNGGDEHQAHSYVGKHRAEDKPDHKSSEHKSDHESSGRHAKGSHSKSESHSSSKSHSGGSKAHSTSGGSSGGGKHGR